MIPNGGDFSSLFLLEHELSQLKGIACGTLVDHILCLELEDGFSEDKVKHAVDHLAIETKKVVFFRKIPRDPRHHSKLDYSKLRKLLQ